MEKDDQRQAASLPEFPTLILEPSPTSDNIIITLGRPHGQPYQSWAAPAEMAGLAASCFLAAYRDHPPEALGDMLMIYTHGLRLGPGRLRRLCDYIAHPSANLRAGHLPVNPNE